MSVIAPADKTVRTVRRARMLHRIGAGRKRQRIPRAQYPKQIEAEYGARLTELVVHRTRAAIGHILHDLPDIVAREQAKRRDSASREDASELEMLRQMFERARGAIGSAARPTEVESLARMFGERTASFQRVQLGRQVRAALGADVSASDHRIPSLLEHFVHENVSLIKTIPGRLLDDVEKVAHRAITSGITKDELAGEIQGRFGVSERHARLIARDQVGKLYGQANAYRQQDLGIESFTWQTAGDERVRDEHAALDGREFRWDDPPDEGFPGEPIQCRCTAEPVMGNLINALADAQDE